MVAAGLGLALTGIGATVAVSAVVVTGLAVFGPGIGTCDVSMNVEGAVNERALDRTVMPLFHAMFSGGTILGAALGAAAELAGIAVAIYLSIIGAAMIIGVLIAVRCLQRDPFGVHSADGAGSAESESASISAGGPGSVSGVIAGRC